MRSASGLVPFSSLNLRTNYETNCLRLFMRWARSQHHCNRRDIDRLDAERRTRGVHPETDDGWFEDVLDLDAATRVLTEKRRELLERIDEGDVESVRSPANDLGRDKASVSRDLDLLFEHDIVEYERAGARKIPEPKHETVLVKPIL